MRRGQPCRGDSGGGSTLYCSTQPCRSIEASRRKGEWVGVLQFGGHAWLCALLCIYHSALPSALGAPPSLAQQRGGTAALLAPLLRERAGSGAAPVLLQEQQQQHQGQRQPWRRWGQDVWQRDAAAIRNAAAAVAAGGELQPVHFLHLEPLKRTERTNTSSSGSSSSSGGGSTTQQQGWVVHSGRAPPRRLIQNGDSASITKFPFVAVVTRPDGSYLCAGSLIHPRLVLTAAHCVTSAVGGTPDPRVHLGLDRLEPTPAEGRGARLVAAGAALAALVGLGSTGGVASGPALSTRSVAHPRYNPGNFDYDAAILVLREDAPANIRIVRLPNPDQPLPKAQPLTVLGWGATERNTLSEALQRADVSQLASDACDELFQPYNTDVTARMICMNGRTCAGDSGGPLVMPGNADGDVLMGHVSFGFPRAKGQGCPLPNPATVFANLRNPDINGWVRSVIARLQQQSSGSLDSLDSWGIEGTTSSSEPVVGEEGHR